MKTINTTGKSWPGPMMVVKPEVDRGETELEVLLDNPVSASNIMNFLESRGFGVKLRDDEGTITITARKGEPLRAVAFKKQPEIQVIETQAAPRPKAAPLPILLSDPSGTFSVLITRLALGGDQKLGETLMKSFLGSLPKMERPPLVVALINEGVNLALFDSSSCEHLKNIEKRGASILICGVSADNFNIVNQIGAGSISNMFEIIEALNKTDKTMIL